MQRLTRIATATASAALLAFASNVRADVVETRELIGDDRGTGRRSRSSSSSRTSSGRFA